MDKQSWNAKYEGVHIQGDEGFHSGTNSEEGAGGGDHAQYVQEDLNKSPEQRHAQYVEDDLNKRPEQRLKKCYESDDFNFLQDTCKLAPCFESV